jgi:hypothetical protein
MRGQHGALRMALGRVEERTECFAGVATAVGEARGDVVGQLVDRKRTESYGAACAKVTKR